jgi:serine/threonine-protein kinase RsbW
VRVADNVEVRIPAQLSQVFVLRALAATLALRADFDLDEVEDMKLAVDELCSSMVDRACAGETLTCRFDATGGSVGMQVSVGSADDAPVRRHTFGWHVLDALTDELITWTTPGNHSPYLVHVRMTKLRAA